MTLKKAFNFLKMKINIIAFGQVAEALKVDSFIVADIKDTEDLLKYLNLKFPQVQQMEFNIAVNKQIIHGNTIFSNNDTIALLPAFSGG